jgi:hypothetical protein
MVIWWAVRLLFVGALFAIVLCMFWLLDVRDAVFVWLCCPFFRPL